MKNTPADHPDSATLPKALKKIEFINKYMNEQKREVENAAIVKAIQRKFLKGSLTIVTNFWSISVLFLRFMIWSIRPNQDVTQKMFVREGPLQVTQKNKTKQRYFFLFEDCLVYCEEKKASSITSSFRGENKEKIGYVVKGCYSLDKLQFTKEIGLQLFSIIDQKVTFQVSGP